ncbi:MAG: M28 family peptidase [Planctomycetota bacterium]
MRALILVLSLLLCGLAPLDLQRNEINLCILVPGNGDVNRDTLFREFQVLEDLGEFLVVDPRDSDEGLLQKLAIPHENVTFSPEGHGLYVVSLMNTTLEALKRSMDPLYCGKEIVLAALTEAEAMRLTRPVPHCSLENGLRKLSLNRIPPIKPFMAPENWRPGSRAADPKIQAMVQEVNASTIQSVVQDMQNMGERKASSGAFTAETYLVNKFNAIGGLTVSTHHFSGSYADNVIAELPGAVDPSVIFVVGGHYDSTSYSGGAPGADDNASGTAGVYEIARILSQYEFKYTIRFCAFSAEELGLVGSGAYCDQLASQGANVQGMVNLDMTAYRASGDAYDVDFITNYSSQPLIDFCKDMYTTYVPTLGIVQGSFAAGTSDHQSFTQHGYAACFPFEDIDNYSPYIHSSSDVIGTSANDFTLARMITQGALAAMAVMASPLDLEIGHTALQDTTNASGPYTVEADVTSLIGSMVTQVTLHYDTGSGFTSKEMASTGSGDTYISSIPGKADAGYVSYYIEALDNQGNTERMPSGVGADYLQFFVGHHLDIFADDFESSGTNWTFGTGGEWTRNMPTGVGGYDPDHAASEAKVWGNDLGLSGSDGNYEAYLNTWLQSPSIDCTGETGVTLRYYRWLTVEEGKYDQATITVNGHELFSNPYSGDFIDTAWELHEIDISAYADNNPNVILRFTLASDSYVERGGWNIDDLHVGTIAAGDRSTLSPSEVFIKISTGATIDFALNGTSALASRIYVLLISGSGTSPGSPVGSVVLPLNWDLFTDLCFNNLNSYFFSNFLGYLNGDGEATASLNLPVISEPTAIGVVLDFAWATLNPIDFASDAVSVTLVP